MLSLFLIDFGLLMLDLDEQLLCETDVLLCLTICVYSNKIDVFEGN